MKNLSENNILWVYGKERSISWHVIDPEGQKQIESHYQEYLKTKEESGLVYHCFGDRKTSRVIFGQMKTECWSWKCESFLHASGRDKYKLEGRQLPDFARHANLIKDDHLEFKIRRIDFDQYELHEKTFIENF